MDSTTLLVRDLTSATAIAKAAVDVIRICYPKLPAGIVVLCAFALAIGISFLFAAAQETIVWTSPEIARTLIGGITAGFSAIGLTELQKKAQMTKFEAEYPETNENDSTNQ